MKITPEMQQIIDGEVEKHKLQLESTYKNHFNKLKDKLFETTEDYAKKAILNNKNLFESVDKTCEEIHYKPIVEGMIKLFNEHGVRTNLTESINESSKETESLLLEAVHKIQELRDMLAIYEMIQNNLTGMSSGVIDQTLKRFNNDPRYQKMKKEDFLKEVASYVMSIKNQPTRSIQYESVEESDVIDEVDNLLNEAEDEKDVYTKPFAPKIKINIPSLKKKVTDSALPIKGIKKESSEEDPAQEFLDNWT